MPSTAANVIIRSAKLAAVESHHLSAHCAFCWTQGMVSIARRKVHLLRRILDVRVNEERVSLTVDVFDGNLEAVEKHLASSDVTSVACSYY